MPTTLGGFSPWCTSVASVHSAFTPRCYRLACPLRRAHTPVRSRWKPPRRADTSVQDRWKDPKRARTEVQIPWVTLQTRPHHGENPLRTISSHPHGSVGVTRSLESVGPRFETLERLSHILTAPWLFTLPSHSGSRSKYRTKLLLTIRESRRSWRPSYECCGSWSRSGNDAWALRRPPSLPGCLSLASSSGCGSLRLRPSISTRTSWRMSWADSCVGHCGFQPADSPGAN